MTNKEWLDSIGIPDSLVCCDRDPEGSCRIMLRIAYNRQPWQTKKSIEIAKTPYTVSDVVSLAGWLNSTYDRAKIYVGDDIIKTWAED